MTLKYVSDFMKLLLKLIVIMMFVFSTSSTKECTPKKTERGGYVIKNVGIKLCQLKCVDDGQCLSIEYNIETLTCRLSRVELKKIKKKEGYVIFARNHFNVLTGSCTSSMCRFDQRCLKTRPGKGVCVQDEKQTHHEKSPQHKVHKQESFANSPLHEACRKGDINRVEHILSQGLVDINGRDEKQGRTPLMVAAQEGHCKTFDFLIRKGANKSEVDNNCKNALHWACKGGHVGMEECLLPQYSININARNMRPLMQAALRGSRDVLEFLLCTGSNVSQVNDFGNNVLHFACRGGQLNVVQYLLSQSGVDSNRKGKDGKTPLMEAVISRHIDVFEFLMQNGANASQVDDFGNNVLHFACRGGQLDMVQYLLSQSSVDINRRGKDGSTPLMLAVIHRHINVFKLLMRSRANVSQVDNNGDNVMYFACQRGQLDVVKYLLSQSSVDVNSRRRDGKTPLMATVIYRHRDLLELLMRNGADVSQVDDYGENVLHFACRNGDLDAVTYLLSQSGVEIKKGKKGNNTVDVGRYSKTHPCF